ncbi:hypothetical protein FF098_008620 [Parvularcula flava]|uniref:Type IV pilus protein n=1 Tax=Aquisalinus luteolus TaxID=1566827 RepID=A0A8J3A3B7_9PROT|nr:CpaD family pilus assembly protein [Aquisalinus luteolus]NHK27964.1 hypothetical protein [Aquisalinus luteolus]GGH97064.1 type IV pilus protein [Aquisalinus luteolus]
MKKFIALLIATSGLASCASPFNGEMQATTIEEQHPITVEQQVVTMTVAVDNSLSELSAIDKARVKAFADTYFTRGHGPVTITAPSGGGQIDFYGQQVVADIRDALYAEGLDYAAMQGASYRLSPEQSEPEVIISFSNYVASPSACGAWDEEYYRRSHNLRTKNFGCAQQNNLAAMVADPRDLVGQRRLGNPDAAREADVYGKYIRGEVTSSAAEESSEISASDQ